MPSTPIQNDRSKNRTWPRKRWKDQPLEEITTRINLHEHEDVAKGNGLENIEKCREVNRVKGKAKHKSNVANLTRVNKTNQVLKVEGSEVQQSEVKWTKQKGSWMIWSEEQYREGGDDRVHVGRVCGSGGWWEVKDWGGGVSELMIVKKKPHNYKKLYTAVLLGCSYFLYML